VPDFHSRIQSQSTNNQKVPTARKFFEDSQNSDADEENLYCFETNNAKQNSSPRIKVPDFHTLIQSQEEANNRKVLPASEFMPIRKRQDSKTDKIFKKNLSPFLDLLREEQHRRQKRIEQDQASAETGPPSTEQRLEEENGAENNPFLVVQSLNVCSSTPEESIEGPDSSVIATENSFNEDTSQDSLSSRPKRRLTKATRNLSHDSSNLGMLSQLDQPKHQMLLENVHHAKWESGESENSSSPESIKHTLLKAPSRNSISTESRDSGVSDDYGSKQEKEPKPSCSTKNPSSDSDTGNWSSESNTGNEMSKETDLRMKVTCNEMISKHQEFQKVDNDDTSSTSKPGTRSPDELIEEYLRNPDPEGFEHFLRRLKWARRQWNAVRK